MVLYEPFNTSSSRLIDCLIPSQVHPSQVSFYLLVISYILAFCGPIKAVVCRLQSFIRLPRLLRYAFCDFYHRFSLSHMHLSLLFPRLLWSSLDHLFLVCRFLSNNFIVTTSYYYLVQFLSPAFTTPWLIAVSPGPSPLLCGLPSNRYFTTVHPKLTLMLHY